MNNPRNQQLIIEEMTSSINDAGLIKPLYCVVKPNLSGNLFKEWSDCIKQINNIKESGKKIFRINIFSIVPTQSNFEVQHNLFLKSLNELFSNNTPPFSLIMEEPCEQHKIICEIGYVNDPEIEITYGSKDTTNYCMINNGEYSEYWIVGSNAIHPEIDTEESSQLAFTKLEDTYKHLNISFNSIVRQWNYVGKILNKTLLNNKERQHYQMFNETRSEFYGKLRSLSFFPAATGIGMTNNGVCIDTLAMESETGNLRFIPISNPGQQESYKYKQDVLIGAPSCNRKENQPPQFERAMLLVLNSTSRLYVSGTASIIGQETVGIDDIEEQTRVTINNIEILASSENIKNHYPEIQYIPSSYAYIRVYIKYPHDFEIVKEICTAKFGDVPATYVVADICRDNLLVEIEAELV